MATVSQPSLFPGARLWMGIRAIIALELSLLGLDFFLSIFNVIGVSLAFEVSTIAASAGFLWLHGSCFLWALYWLHDSVRLQIPSRTSIATCLRAIILFFSPTMHESTNARKMSGDFQQAPQDSPIQKLSKRMQTSFWSIFSPQKKALFRVFYNEYKNMPLFLVFSLIQLLWQPFRAFYRWLKGGYRTPPFETSAHVETVLWTCKAVPIETSRVFYYLTIHESMEHPKIVLNDNVLLSRMFRDHVVFVDLGRPVQEHYSIRNSVFLWDELVHDAKRLITLPIASFHRLADEFLAPNQKIDCNSWNLTIMLGTSRCGSTLIARMIDFCDPKCLVLGEPTCLFDFWAHFTRLPPMEYEQLLRSTFRLLCKPFRGKKRFFLKPISMTIHLARIYKRICPEARIFFCHRDPIKTALAHERAFGFTYEYRGYQMIQWMGGDWLDWFAKWTGYHRNPLVDSAAAAVWRWPSIFQICCEAWANHYTTYLEQTREFHFPAICYDMVFGDPAGFSRRVLELSGLEPSSENLSAALQTLSTDSQQGKSLSQSELRDFPVTKVTPKLEQQLERFIELCQLPPLSILRRTGL